MNLFRTSSSSSSNANKLALFGAQAFLTGSIGRYLGPTAAFSSVSFGSTTAHSNHFSTIATNGSPLNSSVIVRSSFRGSNSRLFSGMDGPTLTNVDKEVCSYQSNNIFNNNSSFCIFMFLDGLKICSQRFRF